MPVYTVLGGTGSVRSAVIRALLNTPPPNLTLRVFVRSRDKLLSILPDLATRLDTTVVEGSLNNQQLLAQCLSDSEAIFSCIATTESTPGTCVAIDTAAALIAALKQNRAANSPGYTKPVVLVLSSASANHNALCKRVLNAAEDLEAAEVLYRNCRDDDDDLLDAIFVQPPAIMPGTVATGHRISTEDGGVTVSFADVGMGMVEMAEKKGDLRWKGVSVLATEEVKSDWGPNIKAMITGLIAYYLPYLWKAGRSCGIW